MASISLNCVSKKFQDKVILDKVNFDFLPRKKYVISGKSGIGKTTLLNLIAGYLKEDSGEITIDSGLSIEYLFQDECLFSNLTVIDNLFIKACCLEMERERFYEISEKLLRKFNIVDLKNRKVALLSGGEKQRIQLASLLLSNPDIILLDEPTSKLDEENKKYIIQLINKQLEEKLLIIVSHDFNKEYENCILLKLREGILST